VIAEMEGRAAFLTLRGQFDPASEPLFEEGLRRATSCRPLVVVIDLRPLASLDPVGLSAILRAARRSRREGWRLLLVRGRERVDRIFRLTRADERLLMFSAGSPAGPAPSERSPLLD
jgi:anti-anti-sigma factor